MAAYKVCINPALKLAYVSLTTEPNPAGTVMLGQIIFDGSPPKNNPTSLSAITTLARVLLASKKIDPNSVFRVILSEPAAMYQPAAYSDGYYEGVQDTIAKWLLTLKGAKGDKGGNGEIGIGTKGDKGDRGEPGPFIDIMALQTAA